MFRQKRADFGQQSCHFELSRQGENKDEVPEALVKFLEYVALPQEESERTFDDPYVTRLQQTIQRIKRSREMGKRYMTLQEYFREDLIEAKEEGISEGIAIGRSEGLEIGRSEGLEIGRSEGLEIGRSEGLEIGRSEGEEHKLFSQIQKKLARGKSIEQIADEVEESVERVQELIEKLG